MSRPQIGIERLPSNSNRRTAEPKESMNCKSCRKRKIKCNRLRPTCEACQVFQCQCVYDAVPKKRGPKTDVLEALLKRVDGLERRLKEEKSPKQSTSPHNGHYAEGPRITGDESMSNRANIDAPEGISIQSDDIMPASSLLPPISSDTLLDAYFSRVHGKPYNILDEQSFRQRVITNTIPLQLVNAVCAVGARYVENPNGRQASFELSEHYMIQSRSELDVDDPSIDSIQTCLLLVLAFKAAGKGRKAYMIMAAGIGMITALELSRESGEMLSTQEREMRRRLFWACYIMDRFISCGSKRPSLITDDSILLRLPAWYPYTTRPPVDGEFFHSGSNLQYHAGGRRGQGSNGLLIDIVRILGITNKYLAAGGVKGDSHFPWHALSNLSKIRQDLDTWASGTQGAFASVDALFGQPDSTTVVLSKLVYHLIHCLVYRPFLPIDLAELAGNGQQQSWQIEATNLCFLHANAIAELVDLGQSTSIEWPAFTGYCVFTAATVHIHGAHYAHGQRGDVFTSSSDFLLQEVSQLSSLQSTWALIQHHRTALQTIINCHSELIKTLDIDPMRYAPVFHLEDFFDRYSTLGHSIEGAHIVFSELGTVTQDGPSGENDFQGSITLIDRAGRSQLKRASSFSQPKRQSNDQSIGDAMSQSSNVAYQALQSAPVVRQPYTQYQSHAASISAITINTQSLAGSSSSSTNFFPLPHLPLHADVSYDPMLSISQVPDAPYGFDMNGNPVSTVITPGGRSQQSISTSHQEDKEEVDPFLTLLEQLAENEYSRGGPSELDYFLTTSE